MKLLKTLSDYVLGTADGSEKIATSSYWKTFTEYAPQFSTPGGNMYEQVLTRAAVERFARAAAKLEPKMVGAAKPKLQRAMQSQPNSQMTWSTFIARVATILEIDTTAYIVPVFDDYLRITGIYPLKADFAELKEYAGEPWVHFYFRSGQEAALELKYVCILTKFNYTSDYFGEGNKAIKNTLRLLEVQEQAQEHAIKNGAAIRFIARVNGQMHDDMLEKKREMFSEKNLSSQNTSGLLMYDATFDDVKQIEPQRYVLAEGEMQRIKNNVFTYFNINDDILTNHYTEEVWGAYYEGKVEPFAVQLSDGITNLLFSENERLRGNKIVFSSNRLAYASNASKRNMCRDMADRGLMTVNEVREILQLPPVEGGDVFMPRGEYHPIKTYQDIQADISAFSQTKPKKGLHKDVNDPVYFDIDLDVEGDDDIYQDTDSRGEDKDNGV